MTGQETGNGYIPHRADESLGQRAGRVARDAAATPEYREAPAPPQMLADAEGAFTDFCFVSFKHQNQIREAEPGGNPFAILDAGWSAARDAGALRAYEGKVVFPLPTLRADGKTPIEVSIKHQERIEEGRLPWYVSYVNAYVKPAGASGGSPSKAIEEFAWLGSWEDFLADLEEAALPEHWDFADESPVPAGRERAILKSYICTTFYRLKMEDKVAIAGDGSLAAFNTGLVNDRYDDLFACFRPSTGGIPWEFAGFAAAGSRGLGKQLVSLFNPLPEPPRYFQRKEDMLYDLDKELIIDYDHVILDNMARLPLEFLEEELRGCDEATELIGDIRAASDRDARAEAYRGLSALVDDDARLFRRLRARLDDAVDTAKRRVRWNFKTAIPSYYPRGNTMSLLLPLCLLRDNEVDAALVVQLMPSGNYQGQTILTMRQAYTNARLICRPDSDWLTPLNVAPAGDAEDER